MFLCALASIIYTKDKYYGFIYCLQFHIVFYISLYKKNLISSTHTDGNSQSIGRLASEIITFKLISFIVACISIKVVGPHQDNCNKEMRKNVFLLIT